MIGMIKLRRLKGKEKQIGEFFVGKRMNEAADVTFSNPPYTQNTDLRIITKLKESKLVKKIIVVHPSNWLVRPTGGLDNSLPRKFKNMMQDHITNIDMFNGNPVFNIKLFVPCIISAIDFTKKRNSPIKVKFADEEIRNINDINDITIHGKNWDKLVKDFNNVIKTFVEKNGSINDKHTSSQKKPEDKFYIQMANIRGNVGIETMMQEDFFTFVPQDFESTKGIRKESIPLVFSFNSEKEQNNFLTYLLTDFARICLSLIKTSGGLGRGEIALVPWLDFTQFWDDEKLFTFFGYSKGHAIREYAKTFLPDYHDLYPNGKTY